jgi:hypothetical protein
MMTAQTTAIVLASPRFVGPWGDEAWRVSLTLQLVEGGSRAYWLSSPLEPAEHPARPDGVVIEVPTEDGVLDAMLASIAIHLGGSAVQRRLLESHNLEVVDGVRVLAPYWDFSELDWDVIDADLARDLRLGIVVLDGLTLMTEGVVKGARTHGFEVELFGPGAALSVGLS